MTQARPVHPIEAESYRILRARVDLSHLPTPSYAVGASVPSFVCAFLLASAAARLARLGSARAASRGSREPLARSR